MSFKRKFSTLLCLLLIFTFFTHSFADKETELREKKKEAEQGMDEKKEEIGKIQKDLVDVKDKIKSLNSEIGTLERDVREAQEKIDTVSASIEETMEEIRVAEEKLKEKQKLFGARLRVMYKKGDIDYLEAIFSSKNMHEFLSRNQLISAIAKSDRELIEDIIEQRELIVSREKKLLEEKEVLVENRNVLDRAMEELENRRSEHAEFESELNYKLDLAQKEYEELNQLAKNISSEIRELQNKQIAYQGQITGGTQETPTGGKMTWPVPGYGNISSPYGYRVHPVYGTRRFHSGVDIPAPTGVSVVSGESGTVIFSGVMGGYGNTIMVDHGGGIVTLYAHNSSLSVSKGRSVSRGQEVAKIGTTGVSTGPHCHFEVRVNGNYVNPMNWLR